MKHKMQYFRGEWDSLSLREKMILEAVLSDETRTPDAETAIVRLLSDILNRIAYLERTRHYHDPKSML